jgi:hypothetical protein
VIAFKFLARGAVAPFRRVPWPQGGAWLAAPESGGEDAWVRACRADQLAFWLGEELWRVELADPVREERYQLAAPRARLVAQVDGWPAAARELAEACAWRARDLLAARVAGPSREALLAARALPDVDAAAGLAAETCAREAAYVATAVRHAAAGRPAGASLAAAMLAAALAPAAAAAGAFDAERARQGQWLAARLAL